MSDKTIYDVIDVISNVITEKEGLGPRAVASSVLAAIIPLVKLDAETCREWEKTLAARDAAHDILSPTAITHPPASDVLRATRQTKQVIVMRTDLSMRKGKMVAQGAHAALKVFLDRASIPVRLDLQGRGTSPGEEGVLHVAVTGEMLEWATHIFTKVCVSVGSEDDLRRVYEHALELKIPAALIVDSGRTEFHGVPTPTCCAIGPAYADVVDAVTGHLTLL